MHKSPPPSDFQHMLRIADKLLFTNTLEDLKRCIVEDLVRIIPFGCMIGVSGKFSEQRMEPEIMLMHDFPADYLKVIATPPEGIRSSIMQRWMRKQLPVSFDFEEQSTYIDWFSLNNAQEFAFVNVLAHGHYNPADERITYFSFHRFTMPVTLGHHLLIRYLMPHLHCAMRRLCPTSPIVTNVDPRQAAVAQPRLNARQQEILHWLSLGKTNWEISQITGTSVSNVKYHVSTMMRAHSVFSRTALAFKLLPKNFDFYRHEFSFLRDYETNPTLH